MLTFEKIPVDDVAIKVPPQEPVYNSHGAPVPKLPPFTVRSTVPGLHRLGDDEVSEVGSDEGNSSVMVVEAQEETLQFPEASA